jgi:hypothetical protein
MASIQPDTHSFIVKVWLERPVAVWRGRITHVPSGHVRSFTDLGEIAAFVAPYLEQAGASAAQRGKLPRWWRRWVRHWRDR